MTTNDPSRPKATLTCSGRVLVPFTTMPRYASFRNIEDGATPVPATVTIKRGDGGPLRLKVLSAAKPGIEWDLREIKAGEHYELVVGLSPPMKPGKLRSWLRMKTGVKEVPETTIPVYADIPPGWGNSAS